MDDLRKAHKGRSDGAPVNTVTKELKKDLEEAANFEGSQTEKLLMLFCKQTKIRYSSLSTDEKKWLLKIVDKSELAKSHISKRGKGRK